MSVKLKNWCSFRQRREVRHVLTEPWSTIFLGILPNTAPCGTTYCLLFIITPCAFIYLVPKQQETTKNSYKIWWFIIFGCQITLISAKKWPKTRLLSDFCPVAKISALFCLIYYYFINFNKLKQLFYFCLALVIL